MPEATIRPSVPHYEPAPPTNEPLDYADLAVIDLSKAQTPQGRAELAIKARNAMRDVGFFYAINHGLSPIMTTRIFDIADVPFTQVSDLEKQKYAGKMLETGSYTGYKLRRYWVRYPHIDAGVQDQIESYNSMESDNSFQEAIADAILGPKRKKPVSALQIKSRTDGKWRWIRHIENALVINVGDAMEFLSGGYYKATIHRVVQPPVDQRGYTRLGAFYFALPDDDVMLVPVRNSPVLEKYGIKRRFEDSDAPKMDAWRKGRVAAYGKTQLKKGEEPGIEEETIAGVVVKHFN
ncbi:hypothetical protein EW026_g2693 [Hermanssonia centrifuga]|uniref:Clavaminate synthase-like protein n=1 Tax=Hermanssonia centrifuga TaxID=98765 RepID=A0A4S4KNG6_9APHY|nr:hypothetical protein EW026_g2693 [Hermanssonia centrifuga]